MFEDLGSLALDILGNVSAKRVAALDVALVTTSRVEKSSGEIERVAWLRATDQPRRIDASLLTENFSQNWSVGAQGDERTRQAQLLARVRRAARRK